MHVLLFCSVINSRANNYNIETKLAHYCPLLRVEGAKRDIYNKQICWEVCELAGNCMGERESLKKIKTRKKKKKIPITPKRGWKMSSRSLGSQSISRCVGFTSAANHEANYICSARWRQLSHETSSTSAPDWTVLPLPTQARAWETVPQVRNNQNKMVKHLRSSSSRIRHSTPEPIGDCRNNLLF